MVQEIIKQKQRHVFGTMQRKEKKQYLALGRCTECVCIATVFKLSCAQGEILYILRGIWTPLDIYAVRMCV